MNRLLLLLVFLIANNVAHAQDNIPRSSVQVSYDYSYLLPHKKAHNHCQMILLVSPSLTKFYDPIAEQLDSLESTQQGQEVLKEMARAAFASNRLGDMPRKKAGIYVYHDFAEDKAIVFQDSKLVKSWYEEPWEQQDWQLTDSVKTIMGYECQQATADFRGRHWIAWFTSELSMSVGPWKLAGLPGLILQAEDSTRQHCFFINGIETVQRPINMVYNSKDYEKGERKSILKQTFKQYDDPVSALNASGMGLRIVSVDHSANSNHSDEITSDLIETDYK